MMEHQFICERPFTHLAIPVGSPSLQYPGYDDGSSQGRVSTTPDGNLDGSILRDCVKLHLSTLKDFVTELERAAFQSKNVRRNFGHAIEGELKYVRTSMLLGWTELSMLSVLLLAKGDLTLIISTLQLAQTINQRIRE